MWSCLAYIILIAFSGNAFELRSGIYTCVNGNSEDICDQRVRVEASSIETALSVWYEGDCDGQGPYYYPCSQGECKMGGIVFTIKSDSEYQWSNKRHGFLCEFELAEVEE
jgi:hypothetical protein